MITYTFRCRSNKCGHTRQVTVESASDGWWHWVCEKCGDDAYADTPFYAWEYDYDLGMGRSPDGEWLHREEVEDYIVALTAERDRWRDALAERPCDTPRCEYRESECDYANTPECLDCLEAGRVTPCGTCPPCEARKAKEGS